jgi:hypothetical protein
LDSSFTEDLETLTTPGGGGGGGALPGMFLDCGYLIKNFQYIIIVHCQGKHVKPFQLYSTSCIVCFLYAFLCRILRRISIISCKIQDPTGEDAMDRVERINRELTSTDSLERMGTSLGYPLERSGSRNPDLSPSARSNSGSVGGFFDSMFRMFSSSGGQDGSPGGRNSGNLDSSGAADGSPGGRNTGTLQSIVRKMHANE